jgi:hypothetical protein
MNPIDLSHTIEHGMITYRGLPGPLICDFLSRETSRDLYAEGEDLSDLPVVTGLAGLPDAGIRAVHHVAHAHRRAEGTLIPISQP